MRFRGLMLAMALGAMAMAFPAQAASNQDYIGVRAKSQVVALNSADQVASYAGQMVEMDGTISGVFAGSDSTGFLLRIDPAQTLILRSKDADSDIAVGNTVRVLARVPNHGTVLEAVALTRPSAELARTDLANLRGTSAEAQYVAPSAFETSPKMEVDERPPVLYYNGQSQNKPAAPADSSSYANGAGLAANPDVVQLYTQRIMNFNSDVDGNVAKKIAFHILDKSERYGVDPRLTFALVAQESRFDPNAVSYVGAQGLGQLMPGTAAGLGVRNPFDIEDNLDGSVRYLSQQMRAFGGRVSLALAAYNAGPGNVRRYGGVPPFRETTHYVKTIWSHYTVLAGISQSN